MGPGRVHSSRTLPDECAIPVDFTHAMGGDAMHGLNLARRMGEVRARLKAHRFQMGFLPWTGVTRSKQPVTKRAKLHAGSLRIQVMRSWVGSLVFNGPQEWPRG